MKNLFPIVLIILTASVRAPLSAQGAKETLTEARKGHQTSLTRKVTDNDIFATSPNDNFVPVRYRTDIGIMKALLAKPTQKKDKYPAIVWVTGGFPPGGIGSSAWSYRSPSNDQSAKIFRQQGMLVLYPTFRGTYGNPGNQESFFGEVNDLIDAGRYLMDRKDVDPEQIYLGGHSTGGTLALLAAESTNIFKGVFALGAVTNPANYGDSALLCDVNNDKEVKLRSPIYFLHGIRKPTWIIEGEGGNIQALNQFKKSNRNPLLQIFSIKHADHFSVIAPLSELIAKKIMKLKSKAFIKLSENESQAGFDDFNTREREAWDLEHLAILRRRDVNFKKKQKVNHFIWSRKKASLEAAAAQAKEEKYKVGEVSAKKDSDGDTYFTVIISKKISLRSLAAVFKFSAFIENLKHNHNIEKDGWDVKTK